LSASDDDDNDYEVLDSLVYLMMPLTISNSRMITNTELVKAWPIPKY
jgi:hypothetical protein